MYPPGCLKTFKMITEQVPLFFYNHNIFFVITMNLQQKKIIIDHTKQIIYKTKKILKKLSKFIIWIIWDFSGVRFIWQKIRPPINKPPDQRPPATFLLWVVSIYLILFGVTSQRYENRVDIIENRANAIFVQLSAPVDSPQFKNALSKIKRVQNMLAPIKPEIEKPTSIYNSLYKNNEYEEMVNLLKETVENYKTDLNGVDLSEVNLTGAQLYKANFQYSNLYNTIFQNAYLENADFQNAYLAYADFQNAMLWKADFRNTGLENANFQNACLQDADFQNAINITIEQLSKAETLYNAKFDPELTEQIKKEYPHLLKGLGYKDVK